MAIANTLGKTAGQDQVVRAAKMVSIGSNAQREVEDYRLTRFACYKITLEYPRWNEFRKVIARAVAAAKNTGVSLIEVFREIAENPSEQGGRPSKDYRLTRYACYLIAMNRGRGR